jgi:spore germination protein GerM
MKKGMKSFIIIIVIVAVIVGGYFLYNYLNKDNLNVQGVIKDTSLSARVVTLTDKENNEWNAVITEKTNILDEKGVKIDLKDLVPQFEIEVSGKISKEAITPNSLFASQIKILSSKDIIIISPVDGESLNENEIKLKGFARADFETLNVKIDNTEKGSIELPQTEGKYCYFEKSIPLSNLDLSGSTKKEIVLSVYQKSSEDGSEANKVSINLKLAPKKVFLYFSNTKFDPNMNDCSKVYPVIREVHILTDPGDVMQLLLQGPTEEEKEEGYTSQIPKEARINELSIKDGIAKIDFSNLNPGGSCRVAAIRAEITETLKQFPEVKEVIISVDGNVEEALQP